jgi:hypothetical protein
MSQLYISKNINDPSYVLLDTCFNLNQSRIHELNIDGSLNILDISSNKAIDAKITALFARPNVKNEIVAALILNDPSLCNYSVSDINLNIPTTANIGAGFTDLYYESIANQTTFYYKIIIVYQFRIARPVANGGGFTNFSMKLSIFKPDT